MSNLGNIYETVPEKLAPGYNMLKAVERRPKATNSDVDVYKVLVANLRYRAIQLVSECPGVLFRVRFDGELSKNPEPIFGVERIYTLRAHIWWLDSTDSDPVLE